VLRFTVTSFNHLRALDQTVLTISSLVVEIDGEFPNGWVLSFCLSPARTAPVHILGFTTVRLKLEQNQLVNVSS
jgi:hypothetical protein